MSERLHDALDAIDKLVGNIMPREIAEAYAAYEELINPPEPEPFGDPLPARIAPYGLRRQSGMLGGCSPRPLTS